MQWTPEQEKVIQLRNRNILVSAAAGSGKTAVLVERILTRLLDKDHPVDIDRMLIMTFTRAAAGEMKSRLAKALDQALNEDPENEHLQRQSSLIHNAQITTIDGFCSYIIRNYFHLIDLDPGYRAADEGEVKLMKVDIVREVLEEAHQEKRPEFLNLADSYAPGKTDEALEKAIIKLYDFSTSAPWPEEWLTNSIASYQIENAEDILKSDWMNLLWEDLEKRMQDVKSQTEANLRLCQEAGGPSTYEESALSDKGHCDSLQKLIKEKDFNGIATYYSGLRWKALSRKKDPDAEERKKEQFKVRREEIKETINALRDQYFSFQLEDVLEMLKLCREPMEELIALTLRFREKYTEKKRKKNLIDFGDMEHLALEILVKKEEDGTLTPSEAAMELSEKYEEILVDEYQDSNLVQETLTQMVSGWIKNQNNIFMVGDVKQSIYRFRLARPELFMEKFHTYTLEDSPRQRIDLSRNFRSRKEVLTSVNYIFRKIMGESLGGVEYDSAAALYPGASFPEYPDPEQKNFPVTEVMLMEKDGKELEDEKGELEERQLEALALSSRIHKLMEEEQVYDKDLGAYRPVEYRDIVILLRTISGWADEFVSVLGSQGIPAYTASRTGYFSALEVVTVLNYLRISDNFRQEIPLASVLHSPFAGFTPEDLAILKTACPDKPLYEQIEACLEKVEKPDRIPAALVEKLRKFMENLEEFRSRVPYTPIHQLILYLLEKSGYQDYVCAMPGGEQRKANLDMLVEKAMEYEKTSYRGLFNFIRYVETLQKYEVDFGEVNLASGQQSVQIMSIHKSKGLEFPIVFVAGMGKRFNLQDVNAGILVHAELGLGVDKVDAGHRTRTTTMLKKVMQQKLLEESLGEELRVLYVAMTRAKEKLILAGTIARLEDKITELHGMIQSREEKLSFTKIRGARDYWGWVLPALARHSAMEAIYHPYGLTGDFTSPCYDLWKENSDPESTSRFQISVITAEMLLTNQVEKQVGAELRKEYLKHWNLAEVANADIRKELERRFSYRYPFEALRELPVKITVSDLKKRKFAEEEQVLLEEKVPQILLPSSDVRHLAAETEQPVSEQNGEAEENGDFLIDPIIPSFIQEAEEARGAVRGTAYHRVFQCLDYEKTSTKEEIRQQLAQMCLDRKLDEAFFASISVEDLWKFIGSPLGNRMKAASKSGTLKREQPFVIRQRASEINAAWPSDQTILVQGIMDAYFLENDEIVLVDYKTDHLYHSGQYLDRYAFQLTCYAAALEQITGKKVKQKLIYSLTLHKQIEVC